MENQNIIEIEHLCKTFGNVKAVNDLSFIVKTGELFAFLGVNGAGKSTTISMICGQLSVDSGSILVNGIDVGKSGNDIKKLIGVVFQDSVLDKTLSARENLKCRAALYGITGKAFDDRLKELCDLLKFQDYIDRPIDKLSGGQKRRIDIARALVHRPTLLILDEPTTGLDPQTRKNIWNVIEHLRQNEGMTVLLTTHYMEEATGASYVTVIDHGSLVARGTPLELKNQYVKDYLLIYGVDEDDIKSLNMEYQVIRDGFRIAIDSPTEATKLILKKPDMFKDFELVKGGMDDVFLAVTGKNLGGDTSEDN